MPSEVIRKLSSPQELAWPPSKEDLHRLYVDERLSASKIAKVYGRKYASPKTAESTILYHLKKNGISRRDPAAHVRKVTETMVDGWVARYQKGESLKQIAGDDLTPVTVYNHLRKRGVELRDKVEAQISAVRRFEKTSFDGDATEKAYLLGFTRGDLAVSRHGRAIRVKTSSTHPGMIDLVLSLILPHGPARVYPQFSERTGYEWTVEGELDSTFEFLFTEKDIPPSLGAPREVLLAYLAGLFDSEGSVWLAEGRSFAPRVSFTNKDSSMLDWIEDALTVMGFHSWRSSPDKNHTQQTHLWRNREILVLLRMLPLRHPEKKAKARLLIQGERRRKDLSARWDGCLDEIERDRLQCIESAKVTVAPRRL